MPSGVYKRKSIEERFWEKVDVGEPNECWNWKAVVNWNGYGSFGLNGKMVRAHRFSWWLHNGEIPKNMYVLHICIANRKCVNPRHLYLGTQQDNMNDRDRQGRQSRLSGEAHGRAKLTDEQVIEIRYRWENEIPRPTQQMLANAYETSQRNISFIVNNRRWRKERNE